MGDSKKTKSQKPLLTPEEILARSFRAKCRFRAVVRMVIRNMYWLEDVDEQELGDDIQKNVMLITRKKDRKSLLTLMDKGILKKALEHRTEAEKHYLNRVIGNLKCFKTFQNEVKSKLAGVTFFYYFGPGRVIVRQGDPAYALYFILTGEVIVSQNVYDPIFDQIINKPLCTMGRGMMFGEVALLHDMIRETTITTNTHCELLCLRRSDFESVLKKTVEKQWYEIQNALSEFTYFQEWDEIMIRECCSLARMRMFTTNQTVLGDGYGLRSFVYFIIKGKCQVIEHLLVTPSIVNGRKRYKLYIPPVIERLSISTTSGSESSDADLKYAEMQLHTKHPESAKSLADLRHIEELQDIQSAAGISLTTVTERAKLKSYSTEGSSYKPSISISQSQRTGQKVGRSAASTLKLGKKTEDIIEKLNRTPTVINLSSKLAPAVSDTDFPESVETHFMQVCFLNRTACFGIGENMAHRRIIAVTPTQCLLIPRNWLMQKNAGNIWLRIQQFLNSHIPTTKQVFNEFVSQRKWLSYRKEIAKDILSKHHINSNNTLTNVPYFIRINEQINMD